MGTEESIFSIMCYKHSDLIDYFEIESNGLFGKFFEDLKNEKLERKNKQGFMPINDDLNPDNVALYVITFNSPKQFETLIESMIQYDSEFIDKPKKYLLDNSSDLSTTERYSELCEEFGFEHIKKDNLGICGGRQWVAEHAEENGFDFHFFFEDDMFFYPKKGEVCRNGFNRYVPNLYKNTLEITKKNHFDFLKFNYSEFYGDNGTQWSWYNVPQNFRIEHWPEKPNLPVHGQDPNAPRTKFKHVRTHNGIPFVSGEIYYCNWPQVVTRHGNKKMFLDTTWAHPFEQTWMSHIFQETIKGKINPGLLLMTPTEHDRFEFYDGSLRKES
jgi:ligand-binding SRPBCC domain-containing protein